MPKVLTLGTFDPLHLGHEGLFRQCRNLAGPEDLVVVAVNSDEFVLRYKGAVPSQDEITRRNAILKLDTIDWVYINNDDTMQPDLIRAVQPDILVVGQDWALKDYYAQILVSQEWLDQMNIQLVYVPRTGHWSSTEIKSQNVNKQS